MHLDDLFNSICDCLDPIGQAIAAGHVRRQEHPDLPLAILNYTEKAAYDNAWTPITLACRGLIYNTTTGEIIARPFTKFFNHTQPGCSTIDLTAPVIVTDKMDGSLGVLYQTPDGPAIATRGSFTSEQAIHATAVLRNRYPTFWPAQGYTYLFEIVYPANRIVVDYGDTDDLIGLGVVNIETGEVSSPRSMRYGGWCGPIAVTFEAKTFADALAMPPRKNAEGIVVRCLTTGGMLKIKQEDYVALHRIVTGLSARTVWQHLLAGQPLADLIAPLPDEFHPWVREVADGIVATVAKRTEQITAEFWQIVHQMPDGWDPEDRAARKPFAIAAASRADRWAMFNLLDGRDISHELLKRADPGPCVTPSGRTFTEESA
jgi:RNA ligase